MGWEVVMCTLLEAGGGNMSIGGKGGQRRQHGKIGSTIVCKAHWYMNDCAGDRHRTTEHM